MNIHYRSNLKELDLAILKLPIFNEYSLIIINYYNDFLTVRVPYCRIIFKYWPDESCVGLRCRFNVLWTVPSVESNRLNVL